MKSQSELESLREVFIEYFKNFLYVKECESWLSKEGFRQLFALFGRNSQGNFRFIRFLNKCLLEKLKH